MSLNEWLEDIRLLGRGGWIRVYKSALNAPISDPDRFFKAVKDYGDLFMFDAIVQSSNRKLTGDPLGYVLSIAHRLWREDVEHTAEQEDYRNKLLRGKQATEQANNALAEKLRKARQEAAVERNPV